MVIHRLNTNEHARLMLWASREERGGAKPRVNVHCVCCQVTCIVAVFGLRRGEIDGAMSALGNNKYNERLGMTHGLHYSTLKFNLVKIKKIP